MTLTTAKTQAVSAEAHHVFDRTVREVATRQFYPSICYEHKSTKATENYAWIGATPGVREWLGERKFQELRAATYSLKNQLWESSTIIDKTTIEDDSDGLLASRLEDQATEAVQHPDELVINLLTNGEIRSVETDSIFSVR